MSLDALRASALDATFNILGVPITVTRPAPDDTPIVTTGVWLERPLEEPRAFGQDFQRLDARKVLGIIRTSTLQSVPRGTMILAPELEGTIDKTWQVDGYSNAVEPDLLRVLVVQKQTIG